MNSALLKNREFKIEKVKNNSIDGYKIRYEKLNFAIIEKNGYIKEVKLTPPLEQRLLFGTLITLPFIFFVIYFGKPIPLLVIIIFGVSSVLFLTYLYDIIYSVIYNSKENKLKTEILNLLNDYFKEKKIKNNSET